MENEESKNFTVTVGLEVVDKHGTFDDAVEQFMSKISEVIDKAGGASWLWLETTNFIEYNLQGRTCVMDFCQARDFANIVGLTQDGKFCRPPIPVPAEMVNLGFAAQQLENDIGFMEQLAEYQEAKAVAARG